MPPTTTTGPTSDVLALDVPALALDVPALDVPALDVPVSDAPASDPLASDGLASDVLALEGLVDVGVPFAPPTVAGLGDDALIAASRQVAQVRRRADAVAAVVAAEIARDGAQRISPELLGGFQGSSLHLR